MGSHETGFDPLGHFSITVTDIKAAPRTNRTYISTGLAITMPSPEPTSDPDVRYLTDISYEDKLSLETDYTDRNEWMMYTAQKK